MFGRELASTRSNRIARLSYRLLGDLNMGGRTRAWYVLAELKKLRLDGMKIMDAGSGYGPYSFHIARRHPESEVTGVEIDPVKVALCKEMLAESKLTNLQFLQADLTGIDFRDEFDLVICSDVLEHVPDDQAAVRNIHRALKPGGIFLLHAPGYYEKPPIWERGWIGKTHERWRRKHDMGKPDYYFDARPAYKPDEIMNLLRRTGFKIVRVRPTYGRIGLAAFSLFKVCRLFPPLYPVFLPAMAVMGYAEVIKPPKTGVSLIIISVK